MMKIRVKIKGSFVRAQCLDVAGDCSPDGVVSQLAQQSNLRPKEWCVSLNGKDPLRGSSLMELGLVSGDLLWLVPTVPAPGKVDQSVATVESCDSTPREVDQSVAKMESRDSAPPLVPSHITPPSRFAELLAALYTTAAPRTAAEVALVVGDAVLISEGLTREEGIAILANKAGTYRVKYSFLGKDCHVAMTTMGRVCVMQASVTGLRRAVTCQVKPSDCLNPSAALNEGPERVLLGRMLEVTMRNQLALPLVNAVRAELGLVQKGTLSSLSTEVKLKVLSQLDAASILCVAATCSEFYSLASDGHLWRNLYTRDFGPVGQQSHSGLAWSKDWKEAYKRMYLSQKAGRERRGVVIVPQMVHWPHPQPPHPQVPGIIGGDWDRLPGLRPPQAASDYSSPLRYFFGPRRPVLPWKPPPGSRHNLLTFQPPSTHTPFHRSPRQGFPPII